MGKRLFRQKNLRIVLNERFWMKKAFSLGEGVCIYVEPEKKTYSPKDSQIVLNERFWMKKLSSFVAGVCIYVKTEKAAYSPKDPFRNYSALASQYIQR